MKDKLPKDWKWVKLEDVCLSASSNLSQKKLVDDNGEFPVYGASGFIKNVSFYHRKEDYISIIKDGAGVGRIAIHKAKSSVIGTLQYLIPKENVDIRYLFYFLLGVDFKKYISGSTIPHIYYRHYKDEDFLLIPIKEQQKIVKVLDATLSKIDQAIALVNQNIEKLEQLNASVLDEVFINLKKEKQELLVQIAEVKRGKSKHRPRNDKSLYGGKYPLIQTGDVRRTGKYVTEFSKTYNEVGLAQSKLWKKGTICLTIAANIGEVAILGIDACFPDSVLGIYSKEQNNDYIYYFLKSIQQKLDNKSSAAAQKNLSVSKLSDVLIPVPTIDKQKQIVKYLDHTTKKNNQLTQHYTNKLQSLQDLKKSVLDSAFKGKLKREVVMVEAAFSLPFYQMQLIGLSIQANKQDNIPQGEMAIAKDMYLLDRLYGVNTKMKFVNHSWGPFAPEIKKRVTNKQYFGRKNFPNSQATYLDTVNEEMLLGKVDTSIKQQVFKAIQDLNTKLFLKVSKYDRAEVKELLATVLKCIEDMQTTELSAIREAMHNWKIKQGQYKTKAEKFTEPETKKMLLFIQKQNWHNNLIK